MAQTSNVQKGAYCDVYIPHSPAVGLAQVCFSCAWSAAPRWLCARARCCGTTLQLPRQ